MESNKLTVKFGGGICSCLSVRLDNAMRYFEEKGFFPDEIDSSKQFSFYRGGVISTDFSKILFSSYIKDNTLPYVPFSHGWQYNWYDNIQLSELYKLAMYICPVSKEILEKEREYLLIIGNRTCILYRGNDKQKEITETPYEIILKMAKESESKSFLIQTDEKNFYEAFKKEFPDTIRIEEIPMIEKNINSYVMPKPNERGKFLINFLAALKAIGQANKLITITGNTGLWAVIFRGQTNNVWQYNGNLKEWKKLKE